MLIVLLFSCENNRTPAGEDDAPPYPDSTAFFDSAYANTAFKIDTFFSNRLEATTFNGNILFAERGHIIIDNFYGFATFGSEKDTLTINHSFQLASVSKPITAIAALLMVEEGKLDLKSNVRTFIDSFPYDGITVEMLLSHRSGLSDYHYFCDDPDTLWPDKHQTITNEDAIGIMTQTGPMYYYLPDQQFDYCNTNYMLLATIIENISGMDFEDFVTQRIFEPCGMTSTRIYNRNNKDELVQPCIGYNGAFNECMDIYLNGCVGDKGVYSTVHDLFKLDRALRHGTLLDPELLTLAQEPKSEADYKGGTYGYGWRIKWLENGTKVVYHTGWWKGFRSYFIRIPDSDQTIIVLSNVKRGGFFGIEELIGLLE